MLPRPATGEAIESWCNRNKVLHTIDPLSLSAKLHWVGPRSSSGNVLLYFHGGGYNSPAVGPGHVAFALRCASNASASLALLEYTLAPIAHYPTQLRQAVSALKHILASTPPSKIIIAGDSAGGHLSASLLSHLLHPSKYIEALPLSEKLDGICFICPFVSFDYDKKSYKYNANRDYLSLEAVKELNSNFKPPELSDEDAIKDPQLSPLDAPRGWWKNSPVERMLVVAGTWEVFLDDCVAFGQRLTEEAVPQTKVDVVQCAKEVHAACIVDQMLGLGQRNSSEMDSSKVILAWMNDSTGSG